MKNFLFTTVFILSSTITTFAVNAQVNKENPYEMIEEVAQITFDRFAKEESEISNNPEILKDIVREELMPYIYYQYAALKVLGNYARPKKGASQDEIAAHKQKVRDFMVGFKEYLITSYAQVFTLYNNQKVIFAPAKPIDTQRIVMVGLDIIDDKRPPINIKFKVRKNPKINEWQTYDLVAEGVSLLDAKQKELRTLLAQKGIAEVTDMLETKAAKKIVFEQKDKVAKEPQIQETEN